MSTVTSIKTEINNLISSANVTTGESDSTLHDAVDSLIDGYLPNTAKGIVTFSTDTSTFTVSGLSFRPKHVIITCLDNAHLVANTLDPPPTGVSYPIIAQEYDTSLGNNYNRCALAVYTSGGSLSFGNILSTNKTKYIIQFQDDGFTFLPYAHGSGLHMNIKGNVPYTWIAYK